MSYYNFYSFPTFRDPLAATAHANHRADQRQRAATWSPFGHGHSMTHDQVGLAQAAGHRADHLLRLARFGNPAGNFAALMADAQGAMAAMAKVGDGVPWSPEEANDLLRRIDGAVQDPNMLPPDQRILTGVKQMIMGMLAQTGGAGESPFLLPSAAGPYGCNVGCVPYFPIVGSDGSQW